MIIVRSILSYQDFIQRGTGVDSAMHRNDGAPGFVIGIVDAAAPDDEEITQEQYDTEAAAILAYNEALPVEPSDPIVLSAEEQAEADFDAAVVAANNFGELKAALIDLRPRGRGR